MKSLCDPRSVQKLVFVTSVFVLLAWQAAAQQPTSRSKPAASSQPAAETPATRSLPIIGNGTVNTVPLFTGTYTIGNSLITQSKGALNVSGGVTARSFTGDGTALTNVNAAKLSGLSSSSFAQTSVANTFNADQTINGNVNFTGSANSTLILQGNVFDANGEESANVIGGYPGNVVDPGVIGATIGGGGGLFNSASRRPAALRSKSSRGEAPRINQPIIEERERDSSSSPGLMFNHISGNAGTIAGGMANEITFEGAAIGGGAKNTAGFYGTVAGGNSNKASGSYSTVGGGFSNIATCEIRTANFVCGTTVSGGYLNTAGTEYSNVAGGLQNTASVPDCDATFFFCDSTVGGGIFNTASGKSSTVAGGHGNLASGQFATIPGGTNNSALGDTSFAAGTSAIANYAGSFVWNGCSEEQNGTCNTVQDTGERQFVAAAHGGFVFYTDLFNTAGATLPAGSGSWSSLSDRNAKDDVTPLDGNGMLEKLAAVPISAWHYKGQADSIRHVGPMAQDFHAAFGLGEDDKHISSVDAEGVALAGIQALYKLNQQKDRQIAELSQALAEKSRYLEELSQRLAALEASVLKQH